MSTMNITDTRKCLAHLSDIRSTIVSTMAIVPMFTSEWVHLDKIEKEIHNLESMLSVSLFLSYKNKR